MESKTFPYICNRRQQVNLYQGRQLIVHPSALLASTLRCVLQTPYISFIDTYQWKLTILHVTVNLCLMALSETISLCLICVSIIFIHIPKNHQWATWSSRAPDKNLHNAKAEELKRSTGVVSVKYPPTVKLEKSLVHNSRMSKAVMNYAYLG